MQKNKFYIIILTHVKYYFFMKKRTGFLFIWLAVFTISGCRKKDTQLNILVPAGYQDALTAGRYEMAAASLGNKAFFAGGLSLRHDQVSLTDVQTFYDAVDIYDAATGQWTSAALSQPRAYLAAAAAGSKVVFAGGYTSVSPYYSDKVDIYDVSTGQWSTATLSQPRFYLAAATAGNKIVFAGGQATGSTSSDRVDIYDVSTGQWTTATLSQGRSLLAGAGAGNIIVFAGGLSPTGPSDKADIYDAATGQWTSTTISGARLKPSATSTGNQIIFSGGSTHNSNTPGSDKVDIYHTDRKQWTQSTMQKSRQYFASASLGNKVIMAGGVLSNNEGITNSMEVLDLSDNTTNASTWYLKEPVYSSSAVTVGGKLLVAGGLYSIFLHGEKRYENRKTVNIFEVR
jgi:hypothetical protein